MRFTPRGCARTPLARRCLCDDPRSVETGGKEKTPEIGTCELWSNILHGDVIGLTWNLY